jgi:hypothetical protein
MAPWLIGASHALDPRRSSHGWCPVRMHPPTRRVHVQNPLVPRQSRSYIKPRCMAIWRSLIPHSTTSASAACPPRVPRTLSITSSAMAQQFPVRVHQLLASFLMLSCLQNGTRVFFWGQNGQIQQGTVQATAVMPDVSILTPLVATRGRSLIHDTYQGSQVANVRVDATQRMMQLP